ncbi:MAG: hypothetical protein ABSA69_09710 [Verrucomicrobiota bacterium]
MKSAKFICLSLLISTGIVPCSRAEPYRTDINPALLYYRAFLLSPNLSPADHDYLFTTNWQGQKLPERFGKIVAGYDNELKLVREAAQQKVPCDWGIDMSPGPGTLLPQLAPAKRIAQAARLRAMWDLQHGNQARARDDLVAAFALGRNASRDGTLIGALVQIAIEVIQCNTVAENFGQFSPETLKQLADGFDAAPARGSVAAAITAEKLYSHDWRANKIRALQQENPGNDAKVMEAVRGYIGYADDFEDTNLWQHVLIASGGTSDGVLKLIRDMGPLYPRLARIMTLPLPEYEDQIQKFGAEIRESQNPFVQAVFTDLLRTRGKEFRIQAEQAMVRAAVEYKLHGESGLKSVMDPFGKGPFGFQRFVFEGVDRGFELKSAYAGLGYPYALIFVEKEGPPFRVDGPHIGEAVQP